MTKPVNVMKISKSSAMGLLSTELLKDCFEVCVLELSHLFKTCLEKRQSPTNWGIGEIPPIPKVSSVNKRTENWRLITQIKLPGKTPREVYP